MVEASARGRGPTPDGPRRGDDGRRIPYWLAFALLTLFLGGLTAAFVLVVLPQRYVLQSGLRESGIAFPARAPSFRAEAGVTVAPRPRPPPAVETGPPAPGPAELFWARAVGLLEAGEVDRALRLFEAYLAERPVDGDAWREYGVLLAREGRPTEAEAALERAVRATGDRRARLELARLARDGERTARAVSLYRALLAETGADPSLRHELARTLAWAGRYDEAAAEYRVLLEAEPRPELRLELARALHAAGRPEEARRALAAIPEDAPVAGEVRALDGRIAAELAAGAGEGAVDGRAEPAADPLTRARRAAAEGDLDEAARLYREVLASRPRDAELWLEWADFLQYRREDLEGAREALLRRTRLVEPGPEEALRLARLHAWTGREAEARAALEALLEGHPDRIEAWTLLGDLRRWAGDRPAAARAYRRALEREAGAAAPARGLAAVRADTRALLASRELPGLGPRIAFFRDSDGFRRLEAGGSARRLLGEWVVGARSGYQRLEGFDPSGAESVEEGPFAELEAARWWRQGTIRVSAAAGAEALDAFGAEPRFGLGLRLVEPGGGSLELAYRHEPAHPVTVTLESVIRTVRSDRLSLSAYRPLGGAWAATASAEAGSFRGGGADNWRLGVGGSLQRRLAPWAGAGAAVQLLGYTKAAPVPAARRLYWDPRLFASLTGLLELRTPGESGWTAHGRIRPGIAFVDERDPLAPARAPQLGLEAGFGRAGERATWAVDLFHLRGREGDYNAFGVGLRLSVRP